MRYVKPTRQDVPKGGNFHDLVSSYLCSRAFTTLNRRHIAQLKREHVTYNVPERALARWFMLIADLEFRDEYTDPASTDRAQPKRYDLHRDKLERQSPHRARWVLSHFDASKIAGRRAGGLHGREQGVQKGPNPKYHLFHLLEHWELPARERKKRVLAETGMSASTYYKLLKQVPAVLERRAARREASAMTSAGMTSEEIDALLSGGNPVRENGKL